MAAALFLLLFLQAATPTQAVQDFQQWLSSQPQGDYFELRSRYRDVLKQKRLTDEQIGKIFREIETARAGNGARHRSRPGRVH